MKCGTMKLAKVFSMINILIAMDVNAGNVRSFSTNDGDKKNLNLIEDISTNNLTKKYAIGSRDNIFSRGSDRIVGGQIAPEGRYNYIVSLTNKRRNHRCGGSLIAPDVVLSAAHCPEDIEGGFAEVSRYDRSNNEERFESFPISEIIKHPQYSSTYKAKYDYMLVKLSGKSSAPLIALNGDSNIPSSSSDSLTVMGWGQTGEGKPGVFILREVELKYVTNEVCEASEGTYIYKDEETNEWTTADGNYNGVIDEYDMCASDIDDAGDAEDSCYGDSGGPLIIKGNNQFEDIQVGIVSGGRQCGNVNFPGIYARVSHEIEWIKQTTCDVSSFNPSFSCDPESTLSPSLAPSLSTNPPTPEPLLEANHQVTLKIKLDDHPEDISWEVRSKDESRLYASSGEHKYTTKGVVVTEEIPLDSKRSYKLLIKDFGQNGINVRGPNVILYEGKVGVGRVVFKDWGNWGAVTEKIFWLPSFPIQSRLIGQRCSMHKECLSGYCKWGRCNNRPTKCVDSSEKFYINNEFGRQFCSFVVTQKARYCSWQRIKDKCPVTCDACDDT